MNKNSPMSRLKRAVKQQVKAGNVKRSLHWFASGHFVRSVKIRIWLSRAGAHYLQIGGGRHDKSSQGWINGDVIAGNIYINAARRLPIPDQSVDAVFTEQFFEHLSEADGQRFVSEVYRVLKRGGVLRQSTPDLAKLAEIYLDTSPIVSRRAAIERHMRNHRRTSVDEPLGPAQFMNDFFRLWGHKFVYDRSYLESLHRRIGFANLRWVLFGKSEKPDLEGLERHADEAWMTEGFIMIYEAIK